MQKNPIIISVGGSLMVPDSIDIQFLANLKLILEEQIKKGERFILITGGGKVCRRYQAVVNEFNNNSQLDADWMGIHVTILNANLLKLILKEHVHDKLIGDPTIKHPWHSPILIGAGYEPGHSTDYDAVCIANTYNVKKIINLSNIDYVYDSDPRVNPHARKIEKMKWEEFLEIIPKKWSPGLNSPFDPTASQLAYENGVEVAMINGEQLERLVDYIEGREFIGTKIH
ncbi:MAG: UMP kinase [Candidatus Pacebacteria bacterium]|jgi:uridylate kinase|nr:UMP kinase [Candidatus Paceibacterota bacterium]